MDIISLDLHSRTCNICGGKMLTPFIRDKKTHNCLSTKVDPHGLPSTCLVDEKHPWAKDILSTVTPYLYCGTSLKKIHEDRLSLAKTILQMTKNGMPNAESWLELTKTYDLRKINRFYKKLPIGSELRKPIALIIETNGQSKKKPEPIDLPEEFKKAIQLYLEKSERIKSIKLKHGHDYSANTVYRRVKHAKKFCEFLVSQGVWFLAEISQYHLDEYIYQTNKGAGNGAYTFLIFVQKKFRMIQRFIRPKVKKKPPSDNVHSIKDIPTILAKIVEHDNLEIVVAALLVTLFAQTITKISELKVVNFRRIDGRLEVLFADDWMPLGNLTERFIYKLKPSFKSSLLGNIDDHLFSLTKHKIIREVRKLVGVHMKPLRLAAIANLINSGVTDRISICRGLGVSFPTIAYVEKLFQWDLHSTVPADVVAKRNRVFRGEEI